MKKIFISHSTKDKQFVEKFVELLQLGLGVSRAQIFCTSLNGSLQTGRDYIQRIKDELGNDWAIIAIISNNYLGSKSCMMELGAAWILSEKGVFFPMLLSPVNYEKMDQTLLKGTQMLCMDKQTDLLVLYDECCKFDLTETRSTAEFYERSQKFCEEIKEMQSGEHVILQKNEEGYFETEITAVRDVPEVYRCYRIKGKIEIKEAYREGENHWLFYHTGVFPDLAVGDHVKFKVSKTELRQFPNLKNARNIYPAALRKAEACNEVL